MASYDVFPRTVGTDPGSASPGAQGVSSTSASGGPFIPQEECFYIAAGAGGAADDVTLYSSALPSKRFVLDVAFLPITGVASSTVTLRDATAGGGNALSSALASVTAGTLARTTSTKATAQAAASSMYVRRSDSGVAGILSIFWIPTV
jgi:hypothetical protein